jgi:Omp85 superfamily domain
MLRIRFSLLLILISGSICAQDKIARDTVDAIIFLRNLFNKEQKATSPKFSILPAVGYNPTYGLTLGANGTSVFQTGTSETNPLSTAFANFFYGTKNVLNLQLRQNVFSGNGNYYSLGDIQLGSLSSPTYYPEDDETKYIVRYKTLRVNQRFYRKVKGPFFAGAGIAFELYGKINDENLDIPNGVITPHYSYNTVKSIPLNAYNSNGLMLNLLYHTREHPVRAYGGLFAELVLRMNQEWMGSQQHAVTLSTDIRKYWSLSTVNREHVLAFWHWATYTLSGTLPYLNLPGTAMDHYTRSGRAFTIGRFKGPSYFYLESEYRFPITRNKLFSGVAFVNMQSASNLNNAGLFTKIQPAGGAGLRVLLNKKTRSNLCLDYAIGLNGNGGFFFGLNEVF